MSKTELKRIKMRALKFAQGERMIVNANRVAKMNFTASNRYALNPWFTKTESCPERVR
jgi:hypothetical protein